MDFEDLFARLDAGGHPGWISTQRGEPVASFDVFRAVGLLGARDTGASVHPQLALPTPAHHRRWRVRWGNTHHLRPFA
ncbi:hypothetical protein [Agromyces aerolatus]|uniref:hypothetical protein n=1 Tax=Agromyces sp. LY-1074 TaxID=3074080 RepID=UPI00286220C1|nr:MULTISPECIES: hypothetical protein [unclassified Agromyces]MDR5699200.1 hypothetical protein [Agromyces sp. LY-1074]MDR5705496.1 hypothetical protein [Agromyces sp. LY-1358]